MPHAKLLSHSQNSLLHKRHTIIATSTIINHYIEISEEINRLLRPVLLNILLTLTVLVHLLCAIQMYVVCVGKSGCTCLGGILYDTGKGRFERVNR